MLAIGTPKIVTLVVHGITKLPEALGSSKIVGGFIRSAGEVGDGVAGLKITSRAAEIWDIVEQALNFLTSHELTGLLLVAYLIKRIGFGMWRTAKKSV